MSFPYSSLVDSGNVITEEYVDSFFEQLKTFTNKGIGKQELASAKVYVPNFRHAEFSSEANEGYEKDGYLDSNKFQTPKFFGGPQPRFIAPTGNVYFNSKNYGWSNAACFQADLTGAEQYVGVPDACARIKLKHKSIVNIMTSFYCFEFGGQNNNRSVTKFGGYEGRIAGFVALKINDDVYTSSTQRRIYVAHCRTFHNYDGFSLAQAEGLGKATSQHYEHGKIFFQMIGRHQHHIHAQVELDAGVHDIGLGFSAVGQTEKQEVALFFDPEGEDPDVLYGFTKAEQPVFQRRKMIFFMNRNIVIESNYISNKETFDRDTSGNPVTHVKSAYGTTE